jgi:type IV pilus assembly protein PilE
MSASAAVQQFAEQEPIDISGNFVTTEGVLERFGASRSPIRDLVRCRNGCLGFPRNRERQMKRTNGFTMLELMITVVVIAILAAIVFPSYQRHVIRANESAAQQVMMQIASRAEEYRLDARQYPDGLGSEAGKLAFSVPAEVDRNYTVALTATNTATPPGYTVTATPKADSVQAGECQMTLNHLGVKTGWKEDC